MKESFLEEKYQEEVLIFTKAYLKPCQTSKMERFAKLVNGYRLFTIFEKCSFLDVSQGSENAIRCLVDFL